MTGDTIHNSLQCILYQSLNMILNAVKFGILTLESKEMASLLDSLKWPLEEQQLVASLPGLQFCPVNVFGFSSRGVGMAPNPQTFRHTPGWVGNRCVLILINSAIVQCVCTFSAWWQWCCWETNASVSVGAAEAAGGGEEQEVSCWRNWDTQTHARTGWWVLLPFCSYKHVQKVADTLCLCGSAALRQLAANRVMIGFSPLWVGGWVEAASAVREVSPGYWWAGLTRVSDEQCQQPDPPLMRTLCLLTS